MAWALADFCVFGSSMQKANFVSYFKCGQQGFVSYCTKVCWDRGTLQCDVHPNSLDHARPPRLSFAIAMVLTLKGRRLQRTHCRRGFTRQPESPNVHVAGSRPSNTTEIQREDTERQKKNEIGAGEGKKKSEILGGPAERAPAEGAPAEGGSGVGWSGARWSRGVQTNNNHNNTNTARNGGWRPNRE